MLQRGRKSIANLAGSRVTGDSSHLTAPSSLTTEEKRLFGELVSTCDCDHFRISDLPLLIAFIQATVISQGTAHDPSKIIQWEKATRMLATLATRLRLSPQSRVDPKTLGRQQLLPGLRKPWEDRAPWEKDDCG